MAAVMGIDPSLAGFAFAIAVEAGHELQVHEALLKTKPSGDDVRARCARYREIVQPTIAAVHTHVVTLCVIEGYSFASAGGRVSGHAHDRAELGGILRNALVDVCHQVVEVAPSTVKKFATGKGNADKAEVISALSRRYGRTFKSDDAADAFALLQIGLCLYGIVAPEGRPQAEVIAMLKGHPLPKLTKKQREAAAQGSLLA